MAIEPNLRTLAKAYANGQLEKDKYRIDRTAYIEAVLAGTKLIQAPPQDAAARPPSSVSRTAPGSDTTGKTGERTYASINTSNGSDSPVSQKTRFIVAGVAVAIISIIIIVVLSSGSKPEASLSGPVRTDSAAEVIQTESAASAAQTLLRSFLDSNIWSDANMDAFVQDWKRLSESDRFAIKNSIELGQMTNAIYKKLLEERALSGIGNPETSYEKQRTLVEFASTIGIQDQRISLPEQADIYTP